MLENKEIVHIRFHSIRNLPEDRDAARWDGVFEKGGSAFFDWGPHAIDYSRYMSRLEVRTAQAFFAYPEQYRAPTAASFNFQMSNGATMTMTFVCATPSKPPPEPNFLIHHEGGYLSVHGYDYIEMNEERVFVGEGSRSGGTASRSTWPSSWRTHREVAKHERGQKSRAPQTLALGVLTGQPSS